MKTLINHFPKSNITSFKAVSRFAPVVRASYNNDDGIGGA